MGLGKAITLFLVNGNPAGLVTAYLSGWSGQCIKIPRNKLIDAKKRKEAFTSGVYFLFGFDEVDPGYPKVYIGESDNVYKRLTAHIKEKEFWNEAIVFSSTGDYLTKAHTYYLEKTLIKIASQNAIYSIENSNSGFSTTLPEFEIASMDGYVENIKIILPTLGYNIFTKIEHIKTKKSKEYTYNTKGLLAKGYPSDGGFIVKANSEISEQESKSLNAGVKALRANMIKSGAIVKKDDRLVLTNNYEFSSASMAADVISGNSVSGPRVWKNSAGKTLKQVEEEMFKEDTEKPD